MSVTSTRVVPASGRAAILVVLAILSVGVTSARPLLAQEGGDCTSTCYVGPGGDDANNHGTGPADAFATIQKALDTVATGGTATTSVSRFLDHC